MFTAAYRLRKSSCEANAYTISDVSLKGTGRNNSGGILEGNGKKHQSEARGKRYAAEQHIRAIAAPARARLVRQDADGGIDRAVPHKSRQHDESRRIARQANHVGVVLEHEVLQ